MLSTVLPRRIFHGYHILNTKCTKCTEISIGGKQKKKVAYSVNS